MRTNEMCFNGQGYGNGWYGQQNNVNGWYNQQNYGYGQNGGYGDYNRNCVNSQNGGYEQYHYVDNSDVQMTDESYYAGRAQAAGEDHYGAGVAGTEYITGAQASGTDYSYSAGATGNNFTYGAHATGNDYNYSAAMNGTEYAYGAGATGANYAYGAEMNGTEYAYGAGATGANYAYGAGINGTGYPYGRRKDMKEASEGKFQGLINKMKNNKKKTVIGGSILAGVLVLFLIVKMFGGALFSSGGASSPESAAKKYIQARFGDANADEVLSMMLPDQAKKAFDQYSRISKGISGAENIRENLNMNNSYKLDDVKVENSDAMSGNKLSSVKEEIMEQLNVDVKVEAAEKVKITFSRKLGDDGHWVDCEAMFYCYKCDGRWYAIIRNIET